MPYSYNKNPNRNLITYNVHLKNKELINTNKQCTHRKRAPDLVPIKLLTRRSSIDFICEEKLFLSFFILPHESRLFDKALFVDIQFGIFVESNRKCYNFEIGCLHDLQRMHEYFLQLLRSSKLLMALVK